MGKIARFLTYAYLLRAPVGLWLILAAFVPAASNLALFRGLVIFEHRLEVFWTTYIVFLASAAMMVMVNLILLYGGLRVKGGKEEAAPPRQDNRRTFIVFLICLIPALVFTLWAAYCTNHDNGFVPNPPITPLRVYLAIGAGLLAAAATVILAKILQMWFANPFPGQSGALYLIFPLRGIPWLGPAVERLHSRPSPVGTGLRGLANPLLGLLRKGGEGYFSFLHDGEVRLLPGHAFAFWLALLTSVGYLLSGSAHRREYLSTAAMKPAWFPTVFHVLIAVLLVSWLISALAFFLDRYRVPVITLFLAGALLSVPSGESDHVFDLAASVKLAYPAPAEVLRTKPGRAIVVATEGGGIQAAAWTATVLAHLTQANPEFSQVLTAISSVSGGSVGTLHYLTSKPAVVQQPFRLETTIENAEADSLEGVAWGMVHPDIQRVVFPWILPATVDRGWALERIFAKRSGTSDLLLSDLTRAIDRGAPAVLINSTMVETGAPLTFASTQFPPPDAAAGVHSFHGEFADSDIHLATAVRLSASFPYVSPAVRASSVKNTHFVDGGYYDNYGMVSLIAWLRDALRVQPAPKPVLIVQITSFPPKKEPEGAQQPWPFQAIAPILTLFSTRSHSQEKRDDFEFELNREGGRFASVDLVKFEYNPQSSECQKAPPLSWHLTKREIGCMESAWKDENQNGGRETVARFLRGETLTPSPIAAAAPSQAAASRR